MRHVVLENIMPMSRCDRDELAESSPACRIMLPCSCGKLARLQGEPAWAAA